MIVDQQRDQVTRGGSYAQSIGDYVIAMHVSTDENPAKEREIQAELRKIFRMSVRRCPFIIPVNSKQLFALLTLLARMRKNGTLQHGLGPTIRTKKTMAKHFA